MRSAQPQTALKGGNRAGFVSSLASFGWSVARVTCQCAYKRVGLSLLSYISMLIIAKLTFPAFTIHSYRKRVFQEQLVCMA